MSVYFEVRNPCAPASPEETQMSVAIRVTGVVVGLLGIGLGIVGLVYYASLFGIIGVALGSSLIISALFIGQYRHRLIDPVEINENVEIVISGAETDTNLNPVERTNLIPINRQENPSNPILLNPQTSVPQLNIVSSSRRDGNEFLIQGRQAQTSSCASKIYKINQEGSLKILDLESSLENTYQITALGEYVLYQNKLAVYPNNRPRYFYIFDLNTFESQRFELNEGEQWNHPVFINAELFMAFTNGGSNEISRPQWIHQLTSQNPCYHYTGPAVQDTLDSQFITYREVDTNLSLVVHNRQTNRTRNIQIEGSEENFFRSPQDPYTERRKNAIILTPHNAVIGLNSPSLGNSGRIEMWSLLDGKLQHREKFNKRIISLHQLQGPYCCIVLGVGRVVNKIKVFNSETRELISLAGSARSYNIINYGSLLAFRQANSLFIYNLQNPQALCVRSVNLGLEWVGDSQLSLNNEQLFITLPGEISRSYIWKLVSKTSVPTQGAISIL